MRIYGYRPLGIYKPQALHRVGLLLVGTLACVTSGCNFSSFSYVSETYVALTPQVVTIGCKEPYEVYDNRQLRRMLIVSNALREVVGCNLNEMRIDSDPVASRLGRFHKAARTYLDETVREECKISSDTVLDSSKTEFAYACSAPVERRGTKVPRLPSRSPGGGLSGGFSDTDDDD